MSLRIVLLFTVLLCTAAFGGPVASASPAVSCDLVAAPDGRDDAAGTVAAPLRTPQRLIDRLGPGQTGCLRAGVYADRSSDGYVARFAHGGRRGRPLILRNFPGERATLAGIVYVTRTADDVTISDLVIDDPTTYASNGEITVEINATRTTLLRDEITNRSLKTCVILGSGDVGRAIGTVIRDSILHECGDPDNHMHDHAIYLTQAAGTRIEGNVISGTGGYGVHLYPDAQRTLVRHNVIVGNGGGVIFAGEGDSASSHNVVEENVIERSSQAPDVSSYWGDRVGNRNVARRNCLSGGPVAEHPGFAILGNIVGRALFAGPAKGAFQVESARSCSPVIGNAIAATAASLLRR